MNTVRTNPSIEAERVCRAPAHGRSLVATWLGILLLASCFGARASTESGQFAIKGIGASQCATFLQHLEEGTPNVWMYGGWVYGFMTGENRHSPETFDIVAWEDLDTLTNYLRLQCESTPDAPFAQAVMAMIEALRPARLTEPSAPVQVAVGDTRIVLYQAALVRLQEALVGLGYLEGAADGRFDGRTSEAVMAFQRASGLEVNGLPDQFTLHRLLRGEPVPAAGR